MFNFQKEVVLNNPKDQVRISNDVSVDPNVKVASGMKPKMSVHGGGEYFGDNILDGKVYKTSPVEGVNAKITLYPEKLAQAATGTNIQVFIELGLDNDYRGDFGSAVWYFRKPILVDLDTNKLSVDDLVKAFKTAIPSEYQFLTVKKDSDNVVLEGADCYIKVRSVKVIDFICDEHCEGKSETPSVIAELGDDDSDRMLIGEVGKVDDNTVEFGTYNYMIHNLRLPTYANLRFASPAAVEMPMPGVNYVQYSFAYCVDRGINFGGMSVVGQVNRSTTLHTFFVPDTNDSELSDNSHGNKVFEDYLTKILDNGSIVEVAVIDNHNVTILSDESASSHDLKSDVDA